MQRFDMNLRVSWGYGGFLEIDIMFPKLNVVGSIPIARSNFTQALRGSPARQMLWPDRSARSTPLRDDLGA